METIIYCSKKVVGKLSSYTELPQFIVNGFPCCPLQSPGAVLNKINCTKCEPATYVEMEQKIKNSVQVLNIKPSGF
ncbi:MAG: hypothetical protein NUV87_00445 [Candidatus Roizmanbacteria bacterium]|nr:hypothetical protein [Candidatus Roizmanbacteria bacterium]MCR4312713.1 hypothetical protein [Candidatus Roizmanbacteria bacterium]